ncbi:MAG TPA: PEP/pyruvate-binding domain-containing protein [Anaerolineae bacterium]|nr:PEP/pyruvate-binding domain-containing protein [Anaerolineae bacterium]
MFKLFDLFKKSKISDRISPDESIFKRKYEYFRRLLISNNRALEIITDLEHVFYRDKPFTMAYVLVQSEILIGEVFSIVEDLNALSGGEYPRLFDAVEKIGANILKDLEQKKKLDKTNLVIPLVMLSRENIAEVGGKAANLGEVYNRVGLPVPQGFAVTAYACQHFLDHNDLSKLIDSKLRGLDVNDTETLMKVSAEIQSIILNCELPADLERGLHEAALELKNKSGSDIRLAVRSSATSEDSEASFAGQHSTVLNVTEKNLVHAYKEVVSSTFNPRALFYRRRKGYMDQDVIMSVACIIMVDAQASGVMYTIDPNDSRHAVVMISAVWGLGISAVDGSTDTDFYQVNKQNGLIEKSEIATKGTVCKIDVEGGTKDEAVSDDLKDKACLEPEQIKALFDYGLKLESHYGAALDIEWAIDKQNRLYILQARPLKKSLKFIPAETPTTSPDAFEKELADHAVLIKGGASASEGTASGLAYVLKSDHNLHDIPKGAILIAHQTSPRYVPVMGRISAIVTDVGSVAGHMASVAREFQIPTLVGTQNATSLIEHSDEITVDATNRIVYKGRVEKLLKEKKAINPMKGSPTYKAAQVALKKIAPLNLLDPKQDNFNPDSCQTIHDIIRFAHEMSMRKMFWISDDIKSKENIAVRLYTSLPLSIYVIDLGGGLSIDNKAIEAQKEDVISVPFKALLNGMTHKGIEWSGDIGINWRGFTSIVAESVFRDPLKEGRMGGPNYAVISNEYLNFNSRLGYHFATIDTYCGPVVNDNYITFYFKGGAADIGRRSRRATLITLILKKLLFKVEQKGDMVRGELKKFDQALIEEKLDMIGRLLGSVRLLDMVLSDDGQLEWYEKEFFKENYTFAAGG